MLRQDSNNGGTRHFSEPELKLNTAINDTSEAHRLSADLDLDLDDSTCSTPYVSAPSSPGRGASNSGYFFSAPASPMHYVLSSSARSAASGSSSPESTFWSTQFSDSPAAAEFEFSYRFSPNSSVAVGSMSSADELFFNGQIRPMKLPSHLQRPQKLAPLTDLSGEEENKAETRDDGELTSRGRDLKLRSRSLHRKARSLSPLRTAELEWNEEDNDHGSRVAELKERILEVDDYTESKQNESVSTETTPSCSASSSRSSSSGRNSKKWIFLKDLLYRSKSEGRAQAKEKFWSAVSLSPSKEKNEKSKKTENKQNNKKQGGSKKPTNGISKRRAVPPSAHEVHYTAKRAQAEEMKKRTFLPYRQGLLGCLGFSSKGYSALSGFTKTLNPVSSR